MALYYALCERVNNFRVAYSKSISHLHWYLVLTVMPNFVRALQIFNA
jgi:hypothetical protein